MFFLCMKVTLIQLNSAISQPFRRFLDITLTAKHNITSGKIYKEVRHALSCRATCSFSIPKATHLPFIP